MTHTHYTHPLTPHTPHTQGQLEYAESVLVSATVQERFHAEAWRELGLVLQASGCTDRALDCLLAAAETARILPLRPFRDIDFDL